MEQEKPLQQFNVDEETDNQVEQHNIITTPLSERNDYTDSLYKTTPEFLRRKSQDSFFDEDPVTFKSVIEHFFLAPPITNLTYPQYFIQYMISPFLSGVMAGFGEMMACELFIKWGWRSAPVFFRDRF